jgi:L-asparaginase II
VLAAMAAVACLVTGAVSLFRFKDRSIVVIASTIYGLLNTVLLAFGAMPQA